MPVTGIRYVAFEPSLIAICGVDGRLDDRRVRDVAGLNLEQIRERMNEAQADPTHPANSLIIKDCPALIRRSRAFACDGGAG